MDSKQNNYFDIDALRDVYLEDSFVLGLTDQGQTIEFEFEVVLTDAHPAYERPEPSERHSYMRAVLRFRACWDVVWLRKSLVPSMDANGEIDFGNIDHFSAEGHCLHLLGDWGEVRFQCSDVALIPR